MTSRTKSFGTAVLALAAAVSFVIPATSATETPTCDGKQATIVVQPGGDFVEGTAGDDVIVGSNGHDFIDGRNGNDRICGRAGSDFIVGSDGRDRIFGQKGSDDTKSNNVGVLLGGRGSDLIKGGNGDDTLEGGSSADSINGGPDEDTCTEDDQDDFESCEAFRGPVPV